MIIPLVIIVTALALLTVFQVALACGAPLGQFAWGGKHRVLPRKLRIGSLFSVLIYLFIAALVLSKAEILTVVVHPVALNIGLWSVFGYFVLGIVMNGISPSKRERFVMTPLCIILAVSAFFLATSAPQKPPAFLVDEQAMVGWYAVPNYHTRAEAVQEGTSQVPVEELPVTYRGVFQGEKGSTETGCFVIYEYHDQETSVAELLREKLDNASDGNQKYTSYAQNALSLKTPMGEVPYRLYEYQLEITGQKDYMQGYAWAFVDVLDGYVSVNGVCPRAEELKGLAVPIGAVTFGKET